MNPANDHENTIRAYARDDIETLGARRPLFEDAVEVHTEMDDEPAARFRAAMNALGVAETQRIYEDEWDRALGEVSQPSAVLQMAKAAELEAARDPLVELSPPPYGAALGEPRLYENGKPVAIDRSMLPHGSAWQLTWMPRVTRDHDSYRGQLEQIAGVMEDSVPHADDGTACAVIAYDAIGDALEVQIGLVVAALARDGKRPAASAVEAAREAAAQLGQHMAAAIGCGLNGSAIRDYAQAFADRLAELHRSGIQ